jgi:pimeloyl-ACP methyl ester carboxylesterase
MMRIPFREIYYLVGIGDRAAVPAAEVDAHHALLKRVDGGRAFLRIMRGFELTGEKQRLYVDGLGKRPYPAQVVWGSRDRMLGEDRRRAAMEALGVEEAKMLPARHFLQEDQSVAVAEAIAGLAV